MSTLKEELIARLETLEKKSADVAAARRAAVRELNHVFQEAAESQIDTFSFNTYRIRNNIGAGRSDDEFWLPSDICW